MSLGVLALSGNGHVTERLLVSQVFEGGHHVGLEIVPAETELLVTLVGRHLEKEIVLLTTNLQKDNLEKTYFGSFTLGGSWGWYQQLSLNYL